ncbi:MAG: glycosyltransferase [Candidatus Hatepunaea meridiana]|nr:glycosyltransferase [Candidatus Hatepunaea meridiana]
MSKVEISIIIPTYNSLNLLEQTIACLEKQSPDPQFFQTIVVDDGSTDCTSEFLHSYNGRLNLDVVVFPVNKGRAAARNSGVKKAKGKLLLFIDGDMVFNANLVKDHLNKHSKKEAVILGKVVYSKSLPCKGYQRYIETRGPNKLPPGTPLPGRYFLSGHTSIPKAVFNDVNGFDERFREHGGEDLDLGMSLVSKGYEIIYAPELLTEHLHIRELSDVLRITRKYGNTSIPLLVVKHTELIEQMRLNWMDRKGIIGIIRQIILSKTVYIVFKRAGFLLNNIGAPPFLYDYLVFRNYFIGYGESLLKQV